jgi:5-carboxymethyl-2-hydroxymuconate isomerase
MPHLTLEYSNNLPAPVDFGGLFARLHETLAEIGPFPLEQIKSRAVPHDVFRIGAGAPESVFVHLTAAILTGRDTEQQHHIGEQLLAVLREGFARTWDERPCDITVDIHELPRKTYAKMMNERARAASPPGA